MDISILFVTVFGVSLGGLIVDLELIYNFGQFYYRIIYKLDKLFDIGL